MSCLDQYDEKVGTTIACLVFLPADETDVEIGCLFLLGLENNEGHQQSKLIELEKILIVQLSRNHFRSQSPECRHSCTTHRLTPVMSNRHWGSELFSLNIIVNHLFRTVSR